MIKDWAARLQALEEQRAASRIGPQRLRLNSKISLARKAVAAGVTYYKLDHDEIAIRRTAELARRRASAEERKRRGDARRLRQSKTTPRPDRVPRTPAERAEENRASSLAAYHGRNYNFRRRARTAAKVNKASILPGLLRAAISRNGEPPIASPSQLEQAFRAVLRRPRDSVEGIIRRALCRRFAKECGGGDRLAQSLAGVSIAGLRQHLESLFQPGMTWANYGYRGWHIDHKKPLSSFSLPAQQAEAFHYTNLQPLWAADNMAKGAKTV